jgi:hypothetical protein
MTPSSANFTEAPPAGCGVDDVPSPKAGALDKLLTGKSDRPGVVHLLDWLVEATSVCSSSSVSLSGYFCQVKQFCCLFCVKSPTRIRRGLWNCSVELVVATVFFYPHANG